MPGLVRRRNAEATLWSTPDAPKSQSLAVSCFGVALSTDVWDAIAQKVYGRADYDDYVANELSSTTFFGQKIEKVGAQLIAKLQTAEAALRASGYSTAPTANSGFRKRAAMHVWVSPWISRFGWLHTCSMKQARRRSIKTCWSLTTISRTSFWVCRRATFES